VPAIQEKVQESMVGKMAWVSTASLDGVPNATPKGSVKVVDDEHIVFADLFSLKTRANLQENPHVAVTVIHAESGQEHRVKGTAEMIADGLCYPRWQRR
jgi:predicted pyridoxine 5'-phosphate oxidase superfamily flavin-nucleotide-binding protein